MLRYEGDFKDGWLTGEGKMFYQDGSKYFGQFANAKKSGWGVLYNDRG